MPDAMDPPLEYESLSFPAVARILYQCSCGKEAFYPHFYCFFTLGVPKQVEKSPVCGILTV
jgi:hypothetical protein